MKIIKYKGITIDLARHIKGQKWHNDKVMNLTKMLANQAIYNSKKHDDDKLKKGVVKVWARFQIIDHRKIPFGSQEYIKLLDQLNVNKIRDKHKKESYHHPEHYKNDFKKTNLVILLEIISDWYAANTYRPSAVSKKQMFDVLQKKYKFSNELRSILSNTYEMLKELDND